ncbi:hypothetical protein H5P28_16990 [Ruficoccus amylovorans]|uniref:Uncharacterized protein n=1 Tax=Ruficoccus amylovorans TaxID=1804625 RepID=A0A842HJY2_9BACT|nr:hypothetical protein [Ruficoccus amylovorans]MBC2595964.1 hypothetical protein [Ruficoccus amylovorans]
MRNLCRLISLLLLPSTLTVAVSAAAEPLTSAKASFVAMLWNQSSSAALPEKGLPVDLYYKNGSDYVPLKYRVCQLGEPQGYNGPNPMPIYRKMSALDGQPQYRPIMDCQIPQASQQFIIFIVAEQGGLRSIAVDASPQHIPDGDVMLINLTSRQMAAELRGSQQMLQPSQSMIFKIPKSDTPNLPVKIATWDSGAWKMIYSTSTRIADDRPYIGILYLNEGRRENYRLRFFRNLNLLRNTSTQES